MAKPRLPGSQKLDQAICCLCGEKFFYTKRKTWCYCSACQSYVKKMPEKMKENLMTIKEWENGA